MIPHRHPGIAYFLAWGLVLAIVITVAIVISAAHADTIVIVLPPREDAVARAHREFEQRQWRLHCCKPSPLEEAKAGYRDRQRRLNCVNHPDQCR